MRVGCWQGHGRISLLYPWCAYSKSKSKQFWEAFWILPAKVEPAKGGCPLGAQTGTGMAEPSQLPSAGSTLLYRSI